MSTESPSVVASAPAGARATSPAIAGPRTVLLLSLCLAGGSFLIFRHACDNGFVNYDDPVYVTQNEHVLHGLTYAGVAWSFTTLHFANWHPLTWLSLLFDAQAFGPLQPWGYHFTNVLLHTANVVLLFLVLWWMTRAVACSAVVAALFAIHPVHVESVAWISERKDVLSTFFLMLTLGGYLFAAEKPSVLRWVAVTFLFALGLLSKPMLVTVPFVLLLLDYWPLQRMHLGWRRLLLEKSGLFALSALIAGVTWFAHVSGHEASSRLPVSWLTRAENGLAAYGFYLFKTLWPHNLMVPYPQPSERERALLAAVSAPAVLAVTLLVVKYRRPLPYLFVGWFWYLVTLLPVIGLVRGGMTLLADRYTYVPSIGVFVMLVWGVFEAARRLRLQTLAASAAAVVLASCAVGTWVQIGYWHDTGSLFRHAVAIDDGNYVAHSQLAAALWDQALERTRAGVPADELWDEALTHFRRSAEILPDYQNRFNYGVALANRGHLEQAQVELAAAVEMERRYPQGWYMLGQVQCRLGQFPEAETAYRNVLAQSPGNRLALEGLGRVLGREGKSQEALVCFWKMLAEDRSARANPLMDHVALAWTLTQLERQDQAEKQYAAAEVIDPNWPVTLSDRAWQMATSADPGGRDGFMAVELARPASARCVPERRPRNLDILAAAQAEQADWDASIKTAEQARRAAIAARQIELAREVEKRSALYRSHQAYRATQRSGE